MAYKMKAMSKNTKRNRKKGVFLIETLLTFSVIALAGANYITIVSGGVNKAQWAQANLIEENLQTTYSNWVQLGGTHDGPLFDPSEPVEKLLAPGDVENQVEFTISDITPGFSGDTTRVSYTLEVLDPIGTSSDPDWRVYYIAPEPVPASHVGFVYNTPNNSTSFNSNLNAGETYYLYTYDMNNNVTIGGSIPLLTVPDSSSNRDAKLTQALWSIFTGTAPLTPTSSGSGMVARDSTRGPINSSSIRLNQAYDGSLTLNSDQEVLYDDTYLISFTPTSEYSGIWSVTVAD
jgi:hypothetical protein